MTFSEPNSEQTDLAYKAKMNADVVGEEKDEIEREKIR